VIGLIAAPSALGKSLQPSLPSDARGANSSDDAAIVLVGGFGVLLLGSALYSSRASSKKPTTLRRTRVALPQAE
jgi:hypothetical protein